MNMYYFFLQKILYLNYLVVKNINLDWFAINIEFANTCTFLGRYAADHPIPNVYTIAEAASLVTCHGMGLPSKPFWSHVDPLNTYK